MYLNECSICSTCTLYNTHLGAVEWIFNKVKSNSSESKLNVVFPLYDVCGLFAHTLKLKD